MGNTSDLGTGYGAVLFYTNYRHYKPRLRGLSGRLSSNHWNLASSSHERCFLAVNTFWNEWCTGDTGLSGSRCKINRPLWSDLQASLGIEHSDLHTVNFDTSPSHRENHPSARI